MGCHCSVRYVILRNGTNEQVSHLLTGEQTGVLKVVTCWQRGTCSPHLHQFCCGESEGGGFHWIKLELV